jgi:periplasmic protein TonB
MRHRESGDIACWLVRHAAHHSPSALAARLEEEWLADLSARRGLASRLRFGLGCCWACRIIAHEHIAACAAAPGAAPVQPLAHVHVRFDPSRWSRKTLIVVAVICVHVVLIYAFVNGLAQRVTAMLPFDSPISVTPETRPREQPPPLPPPRFAPTRVEVPSPELTFVVADGPTAIHTAPSTQPPNVPSLPTTPPVVTRVVGGPGAGFPNTDDFYPPMARRLEEAGTAIVQVCVDAGGRLTASPLVVRSSGSARIDAGSLNVAKAGSGHYRPTTENSRPVSSCFAFRVTFRFRD